MFEEINAINTKFHSFEFYILINTIIATLVPALACHDSAIVSLFFSYDLKLRIDNLLTYPTHGFLGRG